AVRDRGTSARPGGEDRGSRVAAEAAFGAHGRRQIVRGHHHDAAGRGAELNARRAVGEAPILALQQLVPELERLHQEPHRTRRTCIFGRLAEMPGPDSEVTAKITSEPVRFAVRQVASELELRLRLVEDGREEVVYLVPFARY